MPHINVPLTHNSYDVVIAKNILSSTGNEAAKLISPGRCTIVTDSNVGPLHAETLMSSLRAASFDPILITVPAGENSKSLAQAEAIGDQMINAKLDRHSSLFALGGGVIGDLAGFVASIFYRGIPFVQIPTTLLAQADSSIGGKTSVNSSLGKNLLGTFYQPSLVITDPALLSTLPKKTFYDGFAEMIKHAIIADREMLKLLPMDQNEDLSNLIAHNVAIKASIVAEDEREISGRRALLNFGHTIGHAIEAAGNYEIFSHGEAIALGTVAALDLSVQHAGLPEEEKEKIITILKSCGFLIRIPQKFSLNKILEALARDKKFQQGAIRFVLTPRLGEAFVSSDITLQEISKASRRLIA
ncbi:MAG: 3-dehydroquinate synthase [Chthoniobacterales bacterium]